MTEPDYIVAGSGINGLVCTAILGRRSGGSKRVYSRLPAQRLPVGLFDAKPDLEYILLLENKFPTWSVISDAFTDEVKAKLKGYSTWNNPGWQTPPLFSDADYRFCDLFKSRCED